MQIHRRTDCQSVLQSLGPGYISICRSPKERAEPGIARIERTLSIPISGCTEPLAVGADVHAVLEQELEAAARAGGSAAGRGRRRRSGRGSGRVEPGRPGSRPLATPVSTSASSARSLRASRTAVSSRSSPSLASRADGDRLGVMGLEHVEIRAVGDLVRLVQHEERGVVLEAELGEDALDGLDLALGLGAGGVDDVQEQVGLAGFLERGLERRDQGVRQVADEADRVGEQRVTAAAGTASGGSACRASRTACLRPARRLRSARS